MPAENFNKDQGGFTQLAALEKKLMSRLVPASDGARMATSRRNCSQKIFEGGTTVMSTLAVVEEILRETAVPMSVREIVERAGVRLPSKSKTPDTVVARDLSMDIKKKGEGSLFIRTSPGRYTLRALVTGTVTDGQSLRAPTPVNGTPATAPQSMSALPQRKPAVAATTSAPRARTDSEAQGGGFAG